ncbi:MAG: hypothetical protein ACLSA6_19265, partial [Holdemania massiliensis]
MAENWGGSGQHGSDSAVCDLRHSLFRCSCRSKTTASSSSTGNNFTNEYSEASSDRRITEDILKQTDAECFGVYNETIYQTFMAIEEKDFFDEYRMTGIDNSGTVIKADTLEDLAEKMGVDQEAFLTTMSSLKTDGIGNEEVVKLADTYKAGP